VLVLFVHHIVEVYQNNLMKKEAFFQYDQFQMLEILSKLKKERRNILIEKKNKFIYHQKNVFHNHFELNYIFQLLIYIHLVLVDIFVLNVRHFLLLKNEVLFEQYFLN